MATKLLLMALLSVVVLSCAHHRPPAGSAEPPTTGGPGKVSGNTLVQRTGAPATGSGELEGRDWVLERFEENGGVRQVPEGVRITARFEQGRVAGAGGCNRYQGPYRIEAGKPTIGPLAVTLMACPEPAAGSERSFLDALNTASAVNVAGDRLTVVHPRGALVFSEESPTQLAGSSWTVTGFNNGKQAVVSVLAGSEATIEFGGDGTVSGSSGCNDFSGQYEVEGESLQLGHVASTRKMCVRPDGIMEQEAQILAALPEVATWHVEDDRLDLFRGDGGRLFSAKRR